MATRRASTRTRHSAAPSHRRWGPANRARRRGISTPKHALSRSTPDGAAMPSMTPEPWYGVFPAITTPFLSNGEVDHAFLTGHARRMLASGIRGLVPLGSLGEGATLTFDEKVAILRTGVAGVGDRVPVVAGISALSTDEAVQLARAAAGAGCAGLMVLPPYVYLGDWPEMRSHVSSVIDATPLPCILYNN